MLADSLSLLDGAAVTNYQITNIAAGTLYQNNGVTPINSGDFITAAQGAAGLKFTPSTDSVANGSFNVQASTAANVCSTQLPFAPLAMFSFAAISSCAS